MYASCMADQQKARRTRVIVPPETRFWRYVEKSDNGCWLWSGSLNKHGYGQLYAGMVDGHRVPPLLAHRLSYQINTGTIPEGLDLDHLCRVRRCVNPSHLEPVTRRDNLLRGEGFSAINTKKDHCPRNHPYDESNTSITKNGWRRCKTCHRDDERERAAKHRSDPES